MKIDLANIIEDIKNMSLDFYPNKVLSLDVILSLVNLLFLKGLHISRIMNR